MMLYNDSTIVETSYEFAQKSVTFRNVPDSITQQLLKLHDASGAKYRVQVNGTLSEVRSRS